MLIFCLQKKRGNSTTASLKQLLMIDNSLKIHQKQCRCKMLNIFLHVHSLALVKVISIMSVQNAKYILTCAFTSISASLSQSSL